MKHLTKNSCLAALFAVGIFIAANSHAQTITVPQAAAYTNDANTVLLQHFDGTTTGSTNGSVFYTNGVFGQGVHVTTSSFVSWNLGALSQGTVEFWGKADTETNEGWAFIVASWQPYNWTTFSTGLSATNHARSQYNDVNDNWDGMTTPAIYTNSVIITTNTWHHYATTWGSQGFHCYVDGTLVYSNSVTLGQNGITAYWSISANSALGNFGPGFNGVIDELRISNVQRIFAPAPSQITFVKAFTLDYQNLLIGSNYQAQASSDLVNWTNWGAAFTATSSTYNNTNYQRIANWNQLFFRLVQQ